MYIQLFYKKAQTICELYVKYVKNPNILESKFERKTTCWYY